MSMFDPPLVPAPAVEVPPVTDAPEPLVVECPLLQAATSKAADATNTADLTFTVISSS
jgi:hypothetical protein